VQWESRLAIVSTDLIMHPIFKVGNFQFCFNAKLSDQSAITMAYEAARQVPFERREALLRALDSGNFAILR
jgi:hypothetical protein